MPRLTRIQTKRDRVAQARCVMKEAVSRMIVPGKAFCEGCQRRRKTHHRGGRGFEEALMFLPVSGSASRSSCRRPGLRFTVGSRTP